MIIIDDKCYNECNRLLRENIRGGGTFWISTISLKKLCLRWFLKPKNWMKRGISLSTHSSNSMSKGPEAPAHIVSWRKWKGDEGLSRKTRGETKGYRVGKWKITVRFSGCVNILVFILKKGTQKIIEQESDATRRVEAWGLASTPRQLLV